MQHPRPLNRADRRRARRTKAVAGAGLALTSAVVGFYPGGGRSARAGYLSALATPTTANCDVSNWNEMRDAIDAFNTHTPATDSGGLALRCSTITLTEDIQSSDIVVGSYESPTLDLIKIPDNVTFTIDGAGNTMEFTDAGGGYSLANGLTLEPSSTSFTATPPTFILTDIEISGTPYGYDSSVDVMYAGDNVVNVEIEYSSIHGNHSYDDSAVRVFMPGNPSSPNFPLSSTLSIIHSEFSDNFFSAVRGFGVTTTVSDSYFHNNSATYVLGRRAAGAAMYLTGTSLTVTDSTFSSNTAGSGAGAIDVTMPEVSISNSTFYDNAGDYAGGLGVFMPSFSEGAPVSLPPSSVTIDHTTFFGDSSSNGGGQTFAGEAVSLYSRDPSATATLTNSVFWGDLSKDAEVGWEIDSAAAPVTISDSALEKVQDALFDLTGNVTTGVVSADMAFGDHGGTPLPSDRFDGIQVNVVTTPHIPTILPADDSPLVDAAGAGGPSPDQRDETRPQGAGPDIGSVEVVPGGGGGGGQDVTVTVTPPANQTITFGQDPNLTPTWSGFTGNDDWTQNPTCAVYNGQDTLVNTTPLPVGDYTVKCSGGTLPSGYVGDYTATRTLTVSQATATLTYTGSQGVATGSSITLSGTANPSACSSGIVYTVNGSPAPAGSFAVTAGNVYEIEMSYSGPNCTAAPVYAIVLAGGSADASNGGGYYNVSGVGRVNFGYTVQINKSKNGSTQVSGQMVWNSQNGKFRFKGNITGFVKTMTGCTTGQICGRIVGTGTLRTRNEQGVWVVVGTGLSYKAAVIDAGTSSVCTGGTKKTCSTVNKPDFFGLDVAGPTFTGEQGLASTGFPMPVQLSGGNLVIK